MYFTSTLSSALHTKEASIQLPTPLQFLRLGHVLKPAVNIMAEDNMAGDWRKAVSFSERLSNTTEMQAGANRGIREKW